MSDVLSRIDHSHDVKRLSLVELETLAGEIRQTILEAVDRRQAVGRKRPRVPLPPPRG